MWTRKAVLAVGGLTEIGFVPDTNLVLVVSHAGRGLVDCRTGAVVARDSSENFSSWWDQTKRAALGIGPCDGQWIEVFGLAGGSGAVETAHGWLASRDGDVVLLARKEQRQRISDAASELRAFAFSDDGQHFVFATSADLTIFEL